MSSISSGPSRKVVIIGGVAGGMSAAARLRRLDEQAEIVVLERGPYVSFANCGLPYYVGRVIPQRETLLVQTEQELEARFNLDIRPLHEAIAIDRARKVVRVREVTTGREYEESYDQLILSPGSKPLVPPVPGVDQAGVFTVRGIPDVDAIAHWIESTEASRAVVVGGGFIGLEMTENLHHRGLGVTLVEMLPQVLPPLDFEMAAMVHHHLAECGVQLCLGDGLARIEEKADCLVVITQSGRQFPADLVILAVGVQPESELAAGAGLKLGVRDAIVVNEHMQTSDPDIYAVGDAVQVINPLTGEPSFVPLAGPANKQGRVAADHICGRPSSYRGTYGTAIVKVFDLTVAYTGLNARQARAAGVAFNSCIVHASSHAGYYPGAQRLTIKLLFSVPEGKLLGAQIVGRGGVDKRIDVLATAIQGGMTVFDLEGLELSYAPPYGSAKDPVNMVGFVASNVLRGDVTLITWDEVVRLDPEQYYVLDVRTSGEYEAGHIPGSLHVPVDELRHRLHELPRDRRPVVVCQAGLRAYVACRILFQHGFRPLNLTGGWETYRYAMFPPEKVRSS
ncbi:MAG: FAD-dependent oxidoreductase [Anaerolineae bacterium]|nr:FAD-dependent oxidoreductase [Anaerolineae bacterium]MDW8098523.1 FAD-dependent oxidoreductase [Anaerolineae bacterium]